MGQRYLRLASSYTGYSNGTAVLHVNQLPPNPAVFAPGPALLFVVVNGVPSVGVQVMVGSGALGKQTVAQAETLPGSGIVRAAGGDADGEGAEGSAGETNGAKPMGSQGLGLEEWCLRWSVVVLLGVWCWV